MTGSNADFATMALKNMPASGTPCTKYEVVEVNSTCKLPWTLWTPPPSESATEQEDLFSQKNTPMEWVLLMEEGLEMNHKFIVAWNHMWKGFPTFERRVGKF